VALTSPVTSGGLVAQVWCGGSGRQVPMARLLAGTDVAPIDDRLGRRAGMLLARSGQSDAIDAAVVCLAADGDDILTSDPGDLHALAQAAEIHESSSRFNPGWHADSTTACGLGCPRSSRSQSRSPPDHRLSSEPGPGTAVDHSSWSVSKGRRLPPVVPEITLSYGGIRRVRGQRSG
jgi:hypothetical protein